MDVTVEIQGNDVGDYLISVEREEKLCSAGQTWTVELDLNYATEIMPWNSIVIYEEGNKVLTGYVASIVDHWGGGPPGITVTGIDTWKLALDGWSTEVYEVNSGDTVKGLMARYLDEVGLSYSISDVVDQPMPDSMYIPYMPISEIIYDLASSVAAYIRVDEDGVVQIGHVFEGDGPDIATGDNLISISVEENDAKARNKVVVWGPNDTGIIRSDEDWATVDHTMVYASPYVKSAGILAATIHAQLRNLEVVKTIDIDGDSTLKVGDKCDIAGPANTWSGEDYCTTITAYWDKKRGYQMTAKFGERCAIYGRGVPPLAADGRDIIVATYDCGVWRCKDIWDDDEVWQPLNIGLSTAYPDDDIPANGGYDCDWFIRDPFEPNSRAFLLTKYGIYETRSLEPGYENWVLIRSNKDMGRDIGSDLTYYGLRIRSTITRQGRYYIALGVEGDVLGGWSKWVAVTDDYFRTITFADHTQLIGAWDFGHQENTGISSWHRLSRFTGDGQGGFAAWHRNDDGCSVSGIESGIASSGGPAAWAGIMCGNELALTPWRVYDPPGSEPSAIMGWRWHTFEHNEANSWMKNGAIHIPYDQVYIPMSFNTRESYSSCSGTISFAHPNIIYYMPGKWVGNESVTTAVYPVKVTYTGGPTAGSYLPSYSAAPITNLPWGGADCHTLQGALGTLTGNRQKVYCFNGGNPSRFATSEDECDTWTERNSVPFKTSCFSGFPYSDQKVYTGRDPTRDESAPHPGYNTDLDLIYVTWDKGDTAWVDVTKNLYTVTQALGLRDHNRGTAGLVTIAPRYI